MLFSQNYEDIKCVNVNFLIYCNKLFKIKCHPKIVGKMTIAIETEYLTNEYD